MADLKWYVVHTYSGYEKAVADAVLKAAENRKMQDRIVDVNIPTETVTEHTDNGERSYERKIFPAPENPVTHRRRKSRSRRALALSCSASRRARAYLMESGFWWTATER